MRYVATACLVTLAAVWAAGCGSDTPRQAGAQPANRPAVARARPATPRQWTPAKAMAEIDKILADAPDLDAVLRARRDALGQITPPARRVASLQDALDRINAVRRRTVTVLGREVTVWKQICRVSSTASTLDGAITLAGRAVDRAQELLRLADSLTAGCRGWEAALRKARADPTWQRLAVLCTQAKYLGADLQQIDAQLRELRKHLGSAARTMRRVQGELQSVTTGSWAPSPARSPHCSTRPWR